MGKFANSIGIWDLKIGKVEVDLKPEMNDVRTFRNILVKDEHRKEKSMLFDKFAEFMLELIRRNEKEEPVEEVKEFIEININKIFEEAMVTFKWTTREELKQQKKETIKELKKSMSNV